MRKPYTIKDIRPIVPDHEVRNLLTAKELQHFYRWLKDMRLESPFNGVYASHLKTWVKLQG
jgi:hypothetical protein